MIVMFTDFGLEGPYLGQMQAVLAREAPGVPVINLFADAPAFEPRAAAYLLAAHVPEFPADTVFLCVVDPDVGTARRAVVVEADGRCFVGPDNGLLNVVAMRAARLAAWEITWRPERLSASFHGRDLFAPVAACIARGENVPGEPIVWPVPEVARWPADLAEVIYIDRYGNAATGIRAGVLSHKTVLQVGGRRLRYCRTFGEAPTGEPFWLENANGLVEIAVNRGSAAALLGLHIGMVIGVE